jgi:flagellar basal body-associated protein FliL
MTPYQKKLQTHMIITLIAILCCAGMVLISEIAHKARKKPSVQAADIYPTINNFETLKKQINDL